MKRGETKTCRGPECGKGDISSSQRPVSSLRILCPVPWDEDLALGKITRLKLTLKLPLAVADGDEENQLLHFPITVRLPVTVVSDPQTVTPITVTANICSFSFMFSSLFFFFFPVTVIGVTVWGSLAE